MTELYFITLLGNINTAMCVVCGLVITTLFVVVLWIFVSDWEEDTLASAIHFTKKWLILPCIISAIGLILIPSKEELYVIYGVGTTIDYIKDNPTARQLPDKVINLLDKIADNAIGEQKTNNIKQK